MEPWSVSTSQSKLIYAIGGIDYLTVMQMNWTPISDRTSEELWTRAAELRRMAETATTREVMEALLRLADRFESAASRAARSKAQWLR
jgi:hypothetical protein